MYLLLNILHHCICSAGFMMAVRDFGFCRYTLWRPSAKEGDELILSRECFSELLLGLYLCLSVCFLCSFFDPYSFYSLSLCVLTSECCLLFFFFSSYYCFVFVCLKHVHLWLFILLHARSAKRYTIRNKCINTHTRICCVSLFFFFSSSVHAHIK